MRTEDDLRAAFLALERHAPEAAPLLAGDRSGKRARGARAMRTGTAPAGSVRPLGLPASPDRAPRSRGWITWAAPAGTAVVVAAIAISLAFARHAPGAGTPAAPNAPAVPAVSPATSATLPEYYAALDDPSGAITQTMPGQRQTPVSIRVGDDRTGRVVATVSPPRGETFAGLTAAADDRTFVAAAEQFPAEPWYPAANPVAWYLLRLTPGSAHPVTLTPLPVPGEPAGTQVSAIALSPDGAELAVMYQANEWSGKTGPLTVALYSLATGKPLRTWTADTNGLPAGIGWYWGRYSNTALTWLDGGRTLAVMYGINTSSGGPPPFTYGFSDVTIRTVDADSPSGNLLASSKVLLRISDPKGRANDGCDSLLLTADAQTVLCGEDAGNTAKPTTADAPKIAAYSVATGRLRLLYQLKGAYEVGLADVLWASPTGSTLLGALYADDTYPSVSGSEPGKADQATGLITNGTFKTVRFPLPTVPYAGEIVF